MFIQEMKKNPLRFVDVVARVKNIQVKALDFYQKFMNFKSVTESYRITFAAISWNSL